ncbi:MAG: hypothetical protein MKZ56_04030, partial [Candidatus Thalassarchaeum sp.]|nr:hypothetical protein [Candidatus Thalassarchaeum sp.]
MSGGLLEKAKQVTGVDDVDVDAAAEAIIDLEPSPSTSSGRLAGMASGGRMLYMGGGLFLLSIMLLFSMKCLDTIPL